MNFVRQLHHFCLTGKSPDSRKRETKVIDVSRLEDMPLLLATAMYKGWQNPPPTIRIRQFLTGFCDLPRHCGTILRPILYSRSFYLVSDSATAATSMWFFSGNHPGWFFLGFFIHSFWVHIPVACRFLILSLEILGFAVCLSEVSFQFSDGTLSTDGDNYSRASHQGM